jgi:hypothetical protein
MLKRFVVAFVTFIALIVPGALLLAMLASPAICNAARCG